jgi:hypothetical protein
VVDPVVGLKILPENPVLEVVNGVVPGPLNFQAKEVKQSGAEAPISGGSWEFDQVEIATIGASTGSLAATGLYGGKGVVTFTYGNDTISTGVTVKLVHTSDPQGQPPEVKEAFQNPVGEDPAMQLLYPYDKTVFPRGLSGPEIQWNGGGNGDVYHLDIQSDTFAYEAWFSAPPPSRYTFPTEPVDIWKKLTTSVNGYLQVNLQRWDGAQAYQAKTQTWRVASANLAGTIYYTALDPSKGDVLRLTPGASAPESFLQTNGRCVACHTVSSNGKRLIAGFDGGWSPWGVFDTATGTNLYDSAKGSGFQAMSPEGDYVLWGQSSQGPLYLSAATDSTVLSTLTTGAGAPVHPAWSNDGNRIAFANRTNGNWLDFTQSSLWVASVTTSPPQFSDLQMIVESTPDRPAVTFPSYTPDSKWLAFMRATEARTQNALGELWLTDGSGTTLPLDALNGTGYLGGTDANRSFEPSFLPLAAGGYFWVVFSSTRAYGNYASTGTRLQLWVAAIEQNPKPGQDPSHPAFRLPGQQLGVANMRGQWARAVCKTKGAPCEAGFDCCDGFCLKNSEGQAVCSDKPSGCVGLGNACQGDADCCGEEVACINGFCSAGKP